MSNKQILIRMILTAVAEWESSDKEALLTDIFNNFLSEEQLQLICEQQGYFK